MLIGINGAEANVAERVGVNKYGFELLWAIYKLQDEWKNRLSFVIYLENSPRQDMPKETELWKYKIIPGRNLWTITGLMPELFKEKVKPRILFTPSHYVSPFAPQAQICSIMDLGYLKFSGQFKKYDFWQLTLWTAWSILVSKYIIAISEATKQDIVRHYPFSRGKIGVTHLAYDPSLYHTGIPHQEIQEVRRKYGIGKNYILFISTLKPSKNIEGLLEAFGSIASSVEEDLVIVGKKGWLYKNIFAKVEDLGITKRVYFTGFIDENDKPALTAGARVFVLPSFWEGFGLDVLSAMACGVPVIAGRAGSLPEIVGDAGLLVDPYDSRALAQAIFKVLKADPKEYNELVAKGLKRVKSFSWEKTARQTLAILENALR